MEISIAKVQDKVSNSGKSYQLVTDTTGQLYSAWNITLQTDTTYNCEVKEKDGYKSISKAFKVGEREHAAEHANIANKQAKEAVPVSVTANSEPKFRINIKQMATGKHNWEVTTRADSIDEIKAQLEAVTTLAREQCEKLNPPTTEMVAGLKGVQ